MKQLILVSTILTILSAISSPANETSNSGSKKEREFNNVLIEKPNQDPLPSILDQLVFEVDRGVLNTISQVERSQVESYLNRVLEIFHGQSATELICKVSSNHGSFFRLYNGIKEIGANSQQQECLQLRQERQNNLVCARSLNHGSFFRIHAIRSTQSIGGDTNLPTCLRLIKSATQQFVCAVSTNHSAFYSVYNQRTGERIDGDLSLEKCLVSIGQSPK